MFDTVPVRCRVVCAASALIVAVGFSQNKNPVRAPEPERRLLTADPGARDYWPCFSPDGKMILFSRTTDHGKRWDLYVVPAGGGVARPLSRSRLSVSANRATWFGRTNQIAFTGTALDGENRVWIIDGDGNTARPLMISGVTKQVAYPHWFPDGNSLAVIDFGTNEVKRVDIARQTATPLTTRNEVLAGMPSVSADGRWLAFAGQKNVGQEYDQNKNTIWLVQSTGSGLRPLEPGQEQGRTPEWASRGDWILFESNRGDPEHRYAVFAMRRDSSGATRLTPPEWDANHPVCSPDGRQIAFSTVHQADEYMTGIAIMNVSGRWCGAR